MTPRRWGSAVLGAVIVVIAAAPVLSPNDPTRQFPGKAYAPPMPPRIVMDGVLRSPFVYPVQVVSRVDPLERRFEEQRHQPVDLVFLANGRLLSAADGAWLPLGGDPLGRDIFSRLLWGGRLSLGVAIVAVLLSLSLGALAGGVAGFVGGALDRVITVIADFTIVLPLIYVVVTLRAAMPLVLEWTTVFWTLAVVMALASWPVPARAVRAVIATERRKEYAEAAYAVGCSPWRILLRHLLPAATGHLATHGILLFPAFVFAEATLSFVGLGFAEPSASWGLMLQDAARVSAMIEAPWLLAPAVAIVTAVLGARLIVAGDRAAETVPVE